MYLSIIKFNTNDSVAERAAGPLEATMSNQGIVGLGLILKTV